MEFGEDGVCNGLAWSSVVLQCVALCQCVLQYGVLSFIVMVSFLVMICHFVAALGLVALSVVAYCLSLIHI